MKEQEENTLTKSRSARSVVAAAFRLFSGNFRHLFRASWLAALIYALINSALGTILVGGASNIALLVAVALLIVIGGLAELMFYSVGINMLCVHSATGKMPSTGKQLPFKIFWRVLKGCLCILVIEIPFVIAFALLYHYKLAATLATPNAHWTLWGAVLIAVIAVAVLQLPLAYSIMRYVMRGELRFWPSLWKSYKSGFSHLGHIFAVMLINAIILIAAHYIITLPAVILEIANTKAQLGAAMGDPLGMPSYMAVLCAVTFLLSGFMQAYIRMTLVFSLYYMYGSIDTGENEKRKFKENIE